MTCPKCKIEARISQTKHVVENDDTPEKDTKLFIEQHFTCRNPQCADFGKEIGVKRNPIRLENG